MDRFPMIVAHRGGAGLWPENSPTAFRHLVGLPVEGVEFDVHGTRDGGFVVIHDAMLDRTSDGQGPVRLRSIGELGRLTLKGTRGDSVPTLEDVLEILKPSPLRLRVEIKSDEEGNPYPGKARGLVERLRNHGVLERATLISFDWAILASLRQWDGTLSLGGNLSRRGLARIGGIERAADSLKEMGVQELSADHRILEPDDVDRIASRGLTVSVWTVNHHSELEGWLSAGVDSVTTDRPDLALEIRDRLAGGRRS